MKKNPKITNRRSIPYHYKKAQNNYKSAQKLQNGAE